VTVETTFKFGGRDVARLGFGAMQLPGRGAFGPPRDHDEAVAVVRRAVERGVNHIDTAQYYGPDVANALLREALHPFDPALALVSKVGAVRDDKGGWLPAQRPEELRAGVESNLTALGVDRLHAVNLRLLELGQGPLFDDQLAAMTTMRDDGLIAGIGLSNITAEQLAYAADRTEIVCVQNAFNMLHQSARSLLDECQRRGIAFVPFFSLGSAFGAQDVRGNAVVQAQAERLGITAAQTALAWALTLAPNVLVIPGTSSLGHLDENLGAAGVALDDEAMNALNGLDQAGNITLPNR
jgi:aryl-alcohol dehydrogenase-like predicted oxidoreductase